MLHCMHNPAFSFKLQPIDASCMPETNFTESENRKFCRTCGQHIHILHTALGTVQAGTCWVF